MLSSATVELWHFSLLLTAWLITDSEMGATDEEWD